MAKKTEEVSEVETVAVEVVLVSKPAEIATDFGRSDLNELRDAVNFLLRR